jgi:hypothetical protein
MSLTTPEPDGVGVGSELPAMLDVRRAEGRHVRSGVQHGEVTAQMGHVQVWRSPRHVRPVDQSCDGVVLPYEIAEVEVAVQQAVRRGRRSGSAQVDRPPPQIRPTSPA